MSLYSNDKELGIVSSGPPVMDIPLWAESGGLGDAISFNGSHNISASHDPGGSLDPGFGDFAINTTSYGCSRDVVFTVTDSGGTVLDRWAVKLSFTNSTSTQVAGASYVLTQVPDAIGGPIARTAWHLCKKQSISLDTDGQAVVDLELLGCDLNGTNGITILDYSILKKHWLTNDPEADINGDGTVQTLDYSILKENFFKGGDDE